VASIKAAANAPDILRSDIANIQTVADRSSIPQPQKFRLRNAQKNTPHETVRHAAFRLALRWR
jgi:hypothetical protein